MSYVVENPEGYFGALLPERGDLLKALEEEGSRENIPIVGPVVGELLYILASVAGARRILELGTATGYSGIYLAGACKEQGGELITLEQNPDMAKQAKENFQKAGLADCTKIMLAPAMESLASLEGPFDLIFLDIEKKDYGAALDPCHRLLRKGGLLVVDNVAFKDADEFNRLISRHPDFRAVHLLAFLPLHAPEQDGLCLALRK